jgi:hypothetical protein
MRARHTGVGVTGEIEAALIERGNTSLADDGTQGVIDHLPCRDNRPGDLRGFRTFSGEVR